MYKDENVEITESVIKISGKTYQASNVTSVEVRSDYSAKGLGYVIAFPSATIGLVCGIVSIGTLMAEETSFALFLLAGGIAAFCFFWLYIAWKIITEKKFALQVTTSGEERSALLGTDQAYLQKIADEIEKSFVK